MIKIYTKENYFYSQRIGLDEYPKPYRRSSILISKVSDTAYNIKSGETLIHENIEFSDIQDAVGNAYTSQTVFEDFYEVNTGKSSPQESGQYFTGWGAYTDTQYTDISPFSITGNDTYVNLPNNKLSTLEVQLPEDITTFYDGTVITGREGDGINITLSFAVVPLTNQITRVTVVPDIGGEIGEIEDYARDVSLGRGQNVTQRYLSSFNAYTLDTWEANGAIMKIKSDQNCEIYGIRYLITRTHKAR